MTKLAGKKAVVTGAGRGLGAAIAIGMAAEGAHVLVVDKDQAAADAVVAQILGSGGTGTAETLDISEREAVLAFGQRMTQQHGTIDILVNNAGISPVVKLDAPNLMQMWDRVIDVNLHGQWDMTIALLPALKHPGASIIFVASIAAP